MRRSTPITRPPATRSYSHHDTSTVTVLRYIRTHIIELGRPWLSSEIPKTRIYLADGLDRTLRIRGPFSKLEDGELSKIVQFAREMLGLTLFPEQEAILQEFDEGNYRQLVLNVGRRSGKSLLADILAIEDAVVRSFLSGPPYMRDGESRIIGIIATNVDQATAHIENIATLCAGSPFASYVERETKTEISFKTGATIKVFPCSARGARGRGWSSAILDEFGHFEEVENSQATGAQVMRAVVPSLGQFKEHGRLLIISTPDWRNTEFGRQVERAEKKQMKRCLYLHRTTAEMRPDMQEFLDEERQRDPDGYVQEYEAQFKDFSGSYLDSEKVIRCVSPGPTTLSPRDGVHYVGAIDPAFTGDRFAMCVAHKDEDGRIIDDGVWTWHKKGFEVTMQAVAQVAEEYRLQELVTDQHSVEAIREALDRRRIHASYKPWTSELKANAYGRLKLAIDAQRIELRDDAAVISELCSLEATATPSGGIRIAARSGHDDRATVIASVVNVLDRPNEVAVIFAGDNRNLAEEDELDAWTRRLNGVSILG